MNARRIASLMMSFTLCAALTLLRTAVAAGTTDQDDVAYCKPLMEDRGRLNDYRLRDATGQMRFSTADNMKYHLGPALHRMQAGEYSRQVMVDLDWTLVRWPNHYEALAALIRYDLAGGKIYEFEPTKCYFHRARQFAPNDINILLAEAYYFWKKGDRDRAIKSYEEVLTIDPNSTDAHYNLGLLYLEVPDFERAREHAVAAYSAGHPLPGLRRKLEAAGHWSEPLPSD